MKELMKASIKFSVILFVILAVIGIAGIVWTFPSAKVLFSTPVALEDVDTTSDLDGTYVKTTLSDLHGTYHKQTIKRSVFYFHVMPIDATHYIAIRVSNADVQFEDRFFEAGDSLLEDISDGTLLSSHQYEVSGTLYRMDEEFEAQYFEYIDSGALPTSDHQYFLPYYLDVSNYGGNHNSTSIYLFGGGGILLIILGLWALLAALLGANQKPIKRYIRSSASPEAMTKIVEDFLANAPVLCDLQYDNNFLCYHPNGMVHFFNDTDKLIWAYKVSERTKHTKLNDKLVLQDNAVLIYFTDGKVNQCVCKTQEEADEMIAILEDLCPKAVTSYALELEEILERDLDAFLKMTYYSTKNNI